MTADSGLDGVAVAAAKSQEQQRQNLFPEQRRHQALCALHVFSGLTTAAIPCERFEMRDPERLGNWSKVTQPGRGYNPDPVSPPLGHHRILRNGGGVLGREVCRGRAGVPAWETHSAAFPNPLLGPQTPGCVAIQLGLFLPPSGSQAYFLSLGGSFWGTFSLIGPHCTSCHLYYSTIRVYME